MRRELQIRKAEQNLRNRRDALRRSMQWELRELNEDEANVGDEADAASQHDRRAVSSNLAEVESRELARVERALERLQDGQYGICEECQRPIAIARLQALPYATTCIKCQRLTESGVRGSALTAHWSRLEEEPAEDDPETLLREALAG